MYLPVRHDILGTHPGLPGSKMSMARMRLALSAFLLLLSGSCLCFSAGQTIQGNLAPLPNQSTPQARRTLTGTVVNSVTGEPIGRALVQIAGPRQSFAFTGPDGRFQIENFPEGDVYISAQKPGFFDRSQTGQGPFILKSGTNEALVKLNPQAGIQGRIIDNDGEPIEGIQVQLMMQQIANGRKEWQPRESVQTRENGTYRMENLMPGVYVVHTVVRPEFGFGFQFGQASGQVQQQAYPERFYPNSPDLASAQALDLKPGEEAEADFTLSPAPAFSVTGSINPPEHGFISVHSADGEQGWGPMMTGVRAGRFRLAAVPAGSWILSFHSRDAQQHYASQTITVGSSNLDGIQLQLQPLASIPIEVAGAADAASMPVQVQLIPKEKQANNQRYMSSFLQPGNSEQRLRIENVPPGKYTVLAQPNGPGCIDSVSSGSADLTRDDLIVNGDSPPPISVRLRDDCPSVSGTVHSESGEVRAFVIVVPDVAFIEPKILQVQGGGQFDMGGLSPGKYRVYAFSNIDGLEYANPEALRDFAGQQIDLQPNQKANVTLELNVRGSN